MLLSRGNIWTFVERPISAVFLLLCVVLIVAQIFARRRKAAVPDVTLVT
jgi:TctA family transporter